MRFARANVWKLDCCYNMLPNLQERTDTCMTAQHKYFLQGLLGADPAFPFSDTRKTCSFQKNSLTSLLSQSFVQDEL